MKDYKQSFIKKWNASGNFRRNSEPIWKWIENVLLQKEDECKKDRAKEIIEAVKMANKLSICSHCLSMSKNLCGKCGSLK